ncbi:hypothetical protein LG52_2664 [Geobacillus kaustophilus]|uniref:Uncharacterized protein n=3 Tax=Geobacillus TaxID=129337 RepID=A0A0D8BSP2_GEOKU|nr:hypothetical protein BJQ97_02895 [Geobacillus sp. TFV-3]KJE27165.1 hypothetical protein LG52_2664 [Geobacillus kaustophilus]
MSNSKIITIYARMSRIIRRKKNFVSEQPAAVIHMLDHIRYNKRENALKEEQTMRTLLVLGVIIAFLTAIFTAGYEDKPGVRQ